MKNCPVCIVASIFPAVTAFGQKPCAGMKSNPAVFKCKVGQPMAKAKLCKVW